MKLKEKLTYENIKELPEGHYEVIDGEVVELAPTGFEHGEYEGELYTLLKKKLRGKGYVAVGEVGVLISKDPLRIRAADVVFISKERAKERPRGILTTPPELVIEIVSPSNTYTEMEERVFDYLGAGVDKVLLVDPQLRKATLFERGKKEAKFYDFEEDIEIYKGIKINLSEIGGEG
ncbi:MAG: Uma2 family endonuclease [Aquificae bacterium]|nr:Uma2 family endonuclease [Aquificota bacterium]